MKRQYPTPEMILSKMGDAPAALVGDFLICRALANPRALKILLPESDSDPMTITPVSAETIKAEGYCCGTYHGRCEATGTP